MPFNDEEAVASELLVQFQQIVTGDWSLRVNDSEFHGALHILQSFIVQHMLQRQEPEHWAIWYDEEVLS